MCGLVSNISYVYMHQISTFPKKSAQQRCNHVTNSTRSRCGMLTSPVEMYKYNLGEIKFNMLSIMLCTCVCPLTIWFLNNNSKQTTFNSLKNLIKFHWNVDTNMENLRNVNVICKHMIFAKFTSKIFNMEIVQMYESNYWSFSRERKKICDMCTVYVWQFYWNVPKMDKCARVGHFCASVRPTEHAKYPNMYELRVHPFQNDLNLSTVRCTVCTQPSKHTESFDAVTL